MEGCSQLTMNQTCKVCGEPAAGFHFGAFTCEGCKSFFGRSYNNMNAITECKNNSKCVINKKNRTACKACRLRKCVMVGMSKSGSRYGRRSNWFKIHCLLQEQGQNTASQSMGLPHLPQPPMPHPSSLNMMGQPFVSPPLQKTSQELLMLGFEDFHKNSTPPAVSSPESHNSESSVELSDARRLPMPIPGLVPPHLLQCGMLYPDPSFFCKMYPYIFNNAPARFKEEYDVTTLHELQRRFLTQMEGMGMNHRQPSVSPVEPRISPPATVSPVAASSPPVPETVQDGPIDLSMRTLSERGSSPAESMASASASTTRGTGSEAEEESDTDSENALSRLQLLRPTPLDLTRKVS